MEEDSEDLTTFHTWYRSFKFKVMPFSLTNGPTTFQRFMNNTFMEYLDDFMTIFMDNLLIYSKSLKEHKKHVWLVLERLWEAGLQASIKKCEFSIMRTKYLGFILTTDRIEVDPEKIQVVAGWQQPTTMKGIQSFLGFCNFYRRFIWEYSQIARPLNYLTHKEVEF